MKMALIDHSQLFFGLFFQSCPMLCGVWLMTSQKPRAMLKSNVWPLNKIDLSQRTKSANSKGHLGSKSIDTRSYCFWVEPWQYSYEVGNNFLECGRRSCSFYVHLWKLVDEFDFSLQHCTTTVGAHIHICPLFAKENWYLNQYQQHCPNLAYGFL